MIIRRHDIEAYGNEMFEMGRAVGRMQANAENALAKAKAAKREQKSRERNNEPVPPEPTEWVMRP